MMKQLATVVGFLVGSCAMASATPSLPSLFSDHMVLQRGKPIPVWGSADPGESLRVTLADRSGEVMAGPDGRWRVVLEPLTAEGPFTLVVEGKTRLTVRDVLIGEVWVASGQSNMHFALRSSSTAAEDLPLASHGGDPPVHRPQIVVPEAGGRRGGAMAHLLAAHRRRVLSRRLLLRSRASPASRSAGGSRSELLAGDGRGGMDRCSFDGQRPGFRRDPCTLKPSRTRRRASRIGPPTSISPSTTCASSRMSPVVRSRFSSGTSERGSCKTTWGGEWSYSWESAPLSRVEMSPAGPSGGGWVLRNAGQLRFSDTALLQLRFRQNGDPMDLTRYSAIRFRHRGRGLFKIHVLQPTIVDWDNYCTQTIAAGADWSELEIHFKDLRQAGWGEVRPFSAGALTGIAIEFLPSLSGTRPPGGLFNGMIAPLVPYAMRGVIWYQGEGNAGRAWQYRKLLPTLIRGWRSAWHRTVPVPRRAAAELRRAPDGAVGERMGRAARGAARGTGAAPYGTGGHHRPGRGGQRPPAEQATGRAAPGPVGPGRRLSSRGRHLGAARRRGHRRRIPDETSIRAHGERPRRARREAAAGLCDRRTRPQVRLGRLEDRR